jgi:hypothetical protein
VPWITLPDSDLFPHTHVLSCFPFCHVSASHT